MSTLEIARNIMEVLEEKKAEAITLIDVTDVIPYTDYFIVCSGTSDRMLRSLGMIVLEEVRNKFKLHGKMEGKPENGWILLDLGDIIVHLLFPDQRKFYQLEDLWTDGKVLVTIH